MESGRGVWNHMPKESTKSFPLPFPTYWMLTEAMSLAMSSAHNARPGSRDSLKSAEQTGVRDSGVPWYVRRHWNTLSHTCGMLFRASFRNMFLAIAKACSI
eukprot:9615484-Heterocapsa_arctica.AAC.1